MTAGLDSGWRKRLAFLTLSIFLAAASLGADTNGLAEAVRKAGEYYRQGLHREAEKAAAEALSILEDNRGAQDFDMAASLNNLGSLVYAQGDLDRAEQLFQRSREAYQADRKSTRLNSSHSDRSRMPSSA